MQPITETTRVVRNEAVPTGEVDGELVALDIERGQCFGIDEIGTELWAIASEPVAVGDMAEELTRRFEVDRGQCLADILPFVSELVEEGLLRRLPD